ncbi:MAG: Flp pilus assembly complex ATPase component TadA [Deltaproteobacteria bacterium]|nr:Flp pilus assembly complex ATPase component TadA [Deltaproteobacteria bacterium]
MDLASLVYLAASRGASDLHLEPGLPAALRVHGELERAGEALSAGLVRGLVREAVGDAAWADFARRGSFDSARELAGVRCRINALHSARGVGLALRLLPGEVPTIDTLNLHPALGELAALECGLVLLSGPTGCGKSSTLAALLQRINQRSARHIVTLEQPIEFELVPERAFVRQREVGRDTPSFDQGLLDALRQDPDVIAVGEMREPATMRLTLNAAETGHLVFATLHSANTAEALQRVVLAFPAEIQAGIAAQLADCLQAVVCQRLRYLPAHELRVPECEILRGSSSARAVVRQSQFVKLGSVLETGGADGMWSRERYRAWLEARDGFQRPAPPRPPEDRPASAARPRPARRPQREVDGQGVLVIDEPREAVAEILTRLEHEED